MYLISTLSPDYEIGGVDYSKPLIDVASEAMPFAKELYCGEAASLDTSIKYSCVYSRSVFQYFPDEQYAESVINSMIEKATYSIGLLDIHNIAKKEEFIEYRRKTIENFDKKYNELNHMFYSKQFFLDIADKHNCWIKFSKSGLSNYWNDPFTFDVYLYKTTNC